MDMCTRRLTRELQAINKNPLTSPSILAVPNEANILEWHYVIEGSAGTPYQGGHYHGKLIFPKEYPLKPPSVIMLTPSGRFKPNRRLCLSMSDFHPESWNPMWSVSTILTGLYSFMVETDPTLGSVETTESQKRKLAIASLEFNVKDPIFCKLFPQLVELHKEKMKKRRESGIDVNDSKDKLSLSTDADMENGVNAIMAAGAGIIALFIATATWRCLV